MPCIPFSTPEGLTGIMCMSRGASPRCPCGNRGVFLCDWKVPTKKSGTCDAPLCGRCATSPALEKHLCRVHRTAWAEWRRAKSMAALDRAIAPE